MPVTARGQCDNNQVAKKSLIAVWLSAGFLSLAAITGSHAFETADAESRTVTALGAEVEGMVARSKPEQWAMKRACLYYALAGQ